MADQFSGAGGFYPAGSFYQAIDVRLSNLEITVGTSLGAVSAAQQAQAAATAANTAATNAQTTLDTVISNTATIAAQAASAAATQVNSSAAEALQAAQSAATQAQAAAQAAGGFVPANYYTSVAVDALLASSYYTRTQIDGFLGAIKTGDPGDIVFTSASTAPTGTLKANGAAVSRTAYAALFARIGTTYGAGDGSTTFNLPDYRGYFLRGLDDGRGIDTGRVLGSLQASQNLAHTHTGSADSAGAHSHTIQTFSTNAAGLGPVTTNGNTQGGGSASTSSAGAHTHTLTIASSGGTEARPINIAVLICIRF